MGQTLENGVYLPSEGERNCYAGLKTNWEILDQKVADVTALQQAVAGVLHREIVESLPTTDIDPNTIYMILSGTSATENVYNEYMYVNNAWELIGTSATDLTNYYTKGDVDGLLLLKANASDLTSHTGDTTIHVTTADKATWNTVTSKANDNDVVHKSGDETVGGEKTFTSSIKGYNSDSTQSTVSIDLRTSKVSRGNTSDGVDTFGFGFRDKNNSALASISCVKRSTGGISEYHTVNTTDSSNNVLSESYSFNLSKDGNSTFRPETNDKTLLGTSTNNWKGVYATNYYYGSNNVEFSTKFVTTDTNQDISANKNFKGLITTIPDSPLWTINTKTTNDITFLHSNAVHVEQRSPGNLTDLSGGAWSIANLGIGCFFFRYNNGADIRYKNFAQNTVNRIPVVSNANRFINDVTPDQDNTYNLGSSSLRWATINGLEPSSLSLPSDKSARIDISSYITNLGNGSSNTYTVPANGYIWLHFTSVTGIICYSQTSGGLTNYAQTSTRYQGDGQLHAFFPVRKDDKFVAQVYTSSTAVVQNAYFIPCQGNV